MSRARQLADLLDSNGDVVAGALDNAPDPDLTPYALQTTVDNLSPADISSQANTATDFFALPKGTTAQRPVSPSDGYLRFNTTEGVIEEYRSNKWQVLSNVFTATGGSETTITEDNVSYKVHTFTSSGTFTVLSGASNVEYLVIAGGGGGGRAYAGGGGAGGYRCNVNGELSGGSSAIESPLLLSAGEYTVTVGAGGAGITGEGVSGNGLKGGNSSISTLIEATGGGGGQEYNRSQGLTYMGGGSGGGGGGESADFGSRVIGQGTNGGRGSTGSLYHGGGGGGAGTAGTVGNSNGHGGNGLASSITGTSVTRGGGGGGGAYNSHSNPAGSGGSGGGASGAYGSANAGSATPNTGGGGGGAGGVGQGPNGGGNGSSGASGIVIIRYPI